MMRGWGVDVDNVTLGIMIEIPSSAIMIEDFIRAGIKFASFGTNDLIQYTLAIDRNNENVADMYNPQHPAVLSLIHNAIQMCRAYDVECSICGQAGLRPEDGGLAGGARHHEHLGKHRRHRQDPRSGRPDRETHHPRSRENKRC